MRRGVLILSCLVITTDRIWNFKTYWLWVIMTDKRTSSLKSSLIEQPNFKSLSKTPSSSSIKLTDAWRPNQVIHKRLDTKPLVRRYQRTCESIYDNKVRQWSYDISLHSCARAAVHNILGILSASVGTVRARSPARATWTRQSSTLFCYNRNFWKFSTPKIIIMLKI